MTEDRPHALLSVADKQRLVPFAESLIDHGFRLIATGGTLDRLRGADLEARSVRDVTGTPELFDGRVKTLHPAIHGGILARSGVDTDERRRRGIPRIELVAVNFYPFDDAGQGGASSRESAGGAVDIGGPTLARSAAKNPDDVWIVVDPSDYGVAVDGLSGDPAFDEQARRERLAAKARRRAARYDAAVAETIDGGDGGRETLGEECAFGLERTETLRYGENPHQAGALYRRGVRARNRGVEKLHGADLSYNNLVDLDAAVGLTEEFERPAVAIVKHTNPAGCAVGTDLETAWERALACDRMSSYGGIVAANRPIGEAAAEAISSVYLEAVAATGFRSEALERLTEKSRLRLVELPDDLDWPARRVRQTIFGTVVQTNDPPVELGRGEVEVPTRREPTEEEWRALSLTWRVVKHVKSNAIVLGAPDRTLGIGAGQMSRVDAVDLAAEKSEQSLSGSALASDAFFPFPDGVESAASAGVRAIVQPGGSKNDGEVVDACDAHDIAMVLTGRRHFRH